MLSLTQGDLSLQGLLKKIIHNPQSDAHRQEAADQYRANGDSLRADYIELQLQRADHQCNYIKNRIISQDSSTSSGEKEIAIEEMNKSSGQIKKLLNEEIRLTWNLDIRQETHELEAQWSNEIQKLVDGLEFHRGFVSMIDAELEHFIQRGEEILKLAPIQHLNLCINGDCGDCIDTLLIELTNKPLLTHIQSLRFDGHGMIKKPGAEAIAKCSYAQELRYINFRNLEVEPQAAETFAESLSLPQLKWVEFPEDLGLSDVVINCYDHVDGVYEGENAKEFESKFGPLPWLHLNYEPEHGAAAPDRFCL